MRHLCLVYPGAAERDGLTNEENAALVDEVLAYGEALKAGGRYIAAPRFGQSATPPRCGSGTARWRSPTDRSRRRANRSAGSP